MDIFNANKRLEELVLFGIDWGIYNRHNNQQAIVPYMFLKKGKEQKTMMLMGEDNPLDFAKSILGKEEKEFEQIAIGFEGYLRDEEGNRTDAIIVHGFDV